MRRNWREDDDAYIMNGHVIRNNNGRSGNNDYSYYNNSNNPSSSKRSMWSYASWKRIGILTVVSTLLFLTNPANNYIINDLFNNNKSRSRQQQQQRRKASANMMPPYNSNSILTNYGLFSLQEEKLSTGIRLHALRQSWSICSYYDSEPFIGDICWMVGSNMIQPGKQLIWDPTDRVHTAHRILCALLILSAVIVFCFPNLPPFFVLFPTTRGIFGTILYGILSVFYTTPNRIIFDILNVNICVYPAIQRISRIVPELSSQKKSIFVLPNGNNSVVDSNFEFILWMIILIVGIGGGCNIITTRLTGGKRCVGITTTIAASLTYVQRTTVLGSPILFYFRGEQPITAVNGYWTMLLMSIFHQHNTDQWLSFVVSWLLAGFMGSIMAKYHLENIFLLGGILKFFGMT